MAYLKRHRKTIAVALLFLALLPAAMAQRPLRSGGHIRYRTSSIYVGVTGAAGTSCYHYTALDDETLGIPLSWNYGICMEWRLNDQLSLGLDAVNAVRKASLSFNTPYLVSYTETDVTNISFGMTERCLDLSLPLTLYLGRTDRWLDMQVRPCLFIAPSACLMYGGELKWTRTHLANNTVLASYELPLSKASSSGYDYGIRAGIGVELRQQTGPYHFIAKIGLSCYYGLYDTFSDTEKDNLLPANQYYGLGDILHEQLDERYFRQMTLYCSVSFPFHKRTKGACYNFEKNRY